MSSLYVDHFGLKEVPFGITPNSKFFFDGHTRGAILQALRHSVMDEDGIIVVVGEVGSGKTMLCRKLAEDLSEEAVDLVYLANPAFGPHEILHSIVADWGLVLQPGRPVLLGIQDALMERHLEGRRVVLLIDEAQAMPPDSLEEIKLLSNLETAQRKLLQIVLFGQEELDDLLSLPRLRQVKDRVVQRFDLPPLGVDESVAYIQRRMTIAGAFDRHVFTAAALSRLANASGGRIRAIHLLADKALLAAYAGHADVVEATHVKQAIKEVRLAQRHKHPHTGATIPALRRLPNMLRHAGWLLAVMLVLFSAWTLIPSAGLKQAVSLVLPSSVSPVAAPASVMVSSHEPQSSVAMKIDSPPAAEMAVSNPTPMAPVVAVNPALADRYSHLAGAFLDAVLFTRRLFDDPTQQGWTVEVAQADDTASAMKAWVTAARVGPAWVHDRQPGARAWPKRAVWVVYVGRYHSFTEALRAQGALQAQLPHLRMELRTLEKIRQVPYPDLPPT